MFRSLHTQLTLMLVALFLVIGVALVMLTRYSADRYHQELTQQLNAPIARYIADEAPLIRAGHVNMPAMRNIARQAMVINPTVEVYLLDTQGRILGHNLGSDALQITQVPLPPIRGYLSGEYERPLRNDDPRHHGLHKIFTAAEVIGEDGLEGYVYTVLGGQKYDQLAAAIGVSDAMRLSTLAIIACIAFGLGSALLIFRRISNRVRVLTLQVNRFCSTTLATTEGPSLKDEIGQLDDAFTAMQRRIEGQMETIREADERRRDLIAGVSHDLRTPLAIMSGYLETLELERSSLTQGQRSHLDKASRQAARLDRLITDLFDLARLDTGGIAVQQGRFSLAELVADIAQEHQIIAARGQVSLSTRQGPGSLDVQADAQLIARAIGNLVDNAIRHTPPRGRITLATHQHGGRIRFVMIDTGTGIASDALPHLFERGFSGEGDSIGSQRGGLGLAIVKRILSLHDSEIRVASRPGRGSAFSFDLAPG
jgi:signal transduction histidine kinase